MSTNDTKVRLSLDVSTSLNDTLEALARKQNSTKSDVLRRAVALMAVVEEGADEGKKVGLVDKDGRIVTIITL